MIEKWLLSKIPTKEEIAITFYKEDKTGRVAIAIITKELLLEEKFHIYEVDYENKNIVLLATAKSPITLEEKYIADKDGQFCLLKSKNKTKAKKKESKKW